ncbi:hypothetical protein [Streptomyces caeruleatus]|uniref:hypothetical protein n=1 Tax=Streptomyces caeruleatus TaxID=661399 RepID=UPI000B25305E|nr:hypothetical protein [Streptomyces caeruleatus]
MSTVSRRTCPAQEAGSANLSWARTADRVTVIAAGLLSLGVAPTGRRGRRTACPAIAASTQIA